LVCIVEAKAQSSGTVSGQVTDRHDAVVLVSCVRSPVTLPS
jgi:hypothetical protein